MSFLSTTQEITLPKKNKINDMFSSTESIAVEKEKIQSEEKVQMDIQEHQQLQIQSQVIYINDGLDVEHVPKLIEPTCCCGCSIGTASIIAIIIHALITWIIYIKLGEEPKAYEGYCYVPLIIFGGMTLCYAGIAFCRTEQLCTIVSAVNHLFSIPIYLSALGLFLIAAYLFYYSKTEVLEKSGETDLSGMIYSAGVQIFLYIGVFLTLMGCFYTYMAMKYQEFGKYLNEENKQSSYN